MKAALKTAEGRFEIDDVDEPALLARNWVKARVRVAGICGTDLRHWEKHDKHLACKIMGHEMAGEVVEVGADVTHLKAAIGSLSKPCWAMTYASGAGRSSTISARISTMCG